MQFYHSFDLLWFYSKSVGFFVVVVAAQFLCHAVAITTVGRDKMHKSVYVVCMRCFVTMSVSCSNWWIFTKYVLVCWSGLYLTGVTCMHLLYE